MSDWQQQRPPPKPGRWGGVVLAVFLMIFGVVLLLPGACSIFFMSQGVVTSYGYLGLIAGAFGLFLMFRATRVR
jgi:hypothetical protein